MSARIERLDAFERWRLPTRVDFAAIVGREAYEMYWQELDRVIGEMERSQAMANDLRAKIANAKAEWHVRPLIPTGQ